MYLLLGCGDVGFAVANKIKQSGGELTIVDRDASRARQLGHGGMGFNVVEGDFSSADVLRSAGIERAEVVLLLTSNYRATERALVAIASLKNKLGIDPVIVARVSDESDATELKNLGVTEALSSSQILANSVFSKASEMDAMIKEKKLRGLFKQIQGKVAVVLQTNPDPDAIACGMAMKQYVKTFGLDADMIYDGTIGHQQNRAMVNLFGLEMIHADKVKFDTYAAHVLVDVATHGNCALPKEINSTVVIDHHPVPLSEVNARYQDITLVGAASTLLTNYLKYAGIDIDSPLATALAFGITRDTLHFTRGATELDFAAFEYLLPRINPTALMELQYPTYSPDTLEAIADAVKHSHVKGGYLVSSIGEIKDRDVLPQAADYLLQREGVTTTLVFGIVKDVVHVSARTKDPKVHVGQVLRDVFSNIGSAGGHPTMAGGQIPLDAFGKIDLADKRDVKKIERAIGHKFWEVVGVIKLKKRKKVKAEVGEAVERKTPQRERRQT